MRKANTFILCYMAGKDSSEDDILGGDLDVSFPCT